MKTRRAPFVLEAMLGLFVLLSMCSFSSAQANTPCDPPCEFGICENSTGTCNCSTNWYGSTCDQFVCEKKNPCLAGGQCERVGETEFNCKCKAGYSGTLCQANDGIQPITLCPADGTALQCEESFGSPNGICIIDPVTKNQSCLCGAGYSGPLCEEYNPCESRGCGIGTCINTPTPDNWYRCECPEGYDETEDCDPKIDVCFNGYCVHGNCSLPVPHNGVDYICTCEPGYTGKNCSTPISYCDDSPCGNGATCTNLPDFTGYTCTCPPYYEGENCTVPYDPCECNTCANNGTCHSQYQNVSEGVYTYSTSCNCSDAFTGANCEVDVDECSTIDTPCQNEGICVNTVGGYLCQCPAGKTGDFCETSVNQCEENPCHNQGVCHNDANGFKCDCNSTEFTGPTCEVPLNQTCHFHQCHFGGVCEFNEDLMKPACTCTEGFMGDFCSFVYHPCSMGNCDPEGTLECISNASSPIQCRCRDGYSGPTCSVNIHDTCQYNQCLNNGTCTNVNGTFSCSCSPGFSGRTCENVIITDCQSGLQCANGTGECVRILDDEFCKCEDGWGGSDCSFNIDECASIPCQHGGTCIDMEGGYRCTCPTEYEGINCQLLKPDCNPNPCKNGGTCDMRDGQSECLCPDGYKGDTCNVEVCPHNCSDRASNGNCDRDCFNAACDYDGGDVCTINNVTDPWADCPMCRDKYNNGYCDQECNNATCLYDGPDCKTQVGKCPQNKVKECTALINNGRCDEKCNTYECPIDAVECGKQLFLQNYLILLVQTPNSIPFDTRAQDQLLFDLVNIINAQIELVRVEELPEDDIPKDFRREGYNYWKLVLRVNIAFCESSCPTTIEQVLRLIEAAYSNGRADFDNVGLIEAISGDAPRDDGGSNSNIGTVIGGVIGVFACVVLIAVVAFVLGKRVRNDGGMRESVKKLVRVRGTFRIPGGSTPEPSEANLMTRGQSCSSDRHSGSIDAFDDNSPSSMRKGSHPLPNFTWSQMEAPLKTVSTDGASSTSGSPKEGGATCIIGQRGKDERKWTYLHCEAARLSSDSRQLMNGSLCDVNAQGPAGLTPLMVAIMSEDKYHRNRGRPGGSIRSESSSGSEYSEYDPMILSQSPKFGRMFSTIPQSKPFDSKIPTLIHAPHSNVNVANDQGETALHLAVKHNKEEYIHYLIIAKADLNIQDKWGKTPLHVAIGAVNDRATQILIDCPNINLELKSHGGITPLMLAVKMGNNRVLQQLLAKNAEITATDAEGRTAVHWAAMINNVEALRLLIKQGPDNVKDAPNHKGETALFLACREGCLGSVRHLLDCYANATLVDSLERSPLLIAFEKQNFDVIEMLQQSNQGPLGGPSPPMYQMKPPHPIPTTSAPPVFGRNGRVKIEPPQVPPVMHSQVTPTSTTAQMRYPVQDTPPMQVDGMPRCSSIEAELADLVASTQYPDMMNYTTQMMFSSEPHPTALKSTPSEIGHSPGNNSSVINPSGGAGGLSPGQTSTADHTTFSPVGSDGVYTATNTHTSPAAGLTPFSCANNPSVPVSSAASLQPLTGSTPLQHLPTPYIEGGGSTHPAQSELQSSPIESAVYNSTVPTSNNSPLMGQTVSPNPTPLTITPAATVNGTSYLQTTTMAATGNTSPSSQYGFPSPPKEAGDYGAYGTPYNGENVNSVNSMTPSPEDGSSHQGDGSPSSQQYTTIHGQYSYSSDAYQISLQPCNTAAIRASNFTGLSSFNPKESTV